MFVFSTCGRKGTAIEIPGRKFGFCFKTVKVLRNQVLRHEGTLVSFLGRFNILNHFER